MPTFPFFHQGLSLRYLYHYMCLKNRIKRISCCFSSSHQYIGDETYILINDISLILKI